MVVSSGLSVRNKREFIFCPSVIPNVLKLNYNIFFRCYAVTETIEKMMLNASIYRERKKERKKESFRL